MKNEILLLPETCELTRLQNENKNHRYHDTWIYGTGYNTRRKDSYQQLTFGNQTITLKADLPNLYELVNEAVKYQTDKIRQTSIKIVPLPLFIREVQTGSHREFRENPYHTGHGYNEIVREYTTYYDDCLCGKEWLEAHAKFVMPEPTIELFCDGKNISLNGLCLISQLLGVLLGQVAILPQKSIAFIKQSCHTLSTKIRRIIQCPMLWLSSYLAFLLSLQLFLMIDYLMRITHQISDKRGIRSFSVLPLNGGLTL
jgi:hypothetical protein